VVFVLAFIEVLYYIYLFAYVELFFHPWDKAELVMVNDLSDMLLNLVCHYFNDILFWSSLFGVLEVSCA
jgi:hypothetical protein